MPTRPRCVPRAARAIAGCIVGSVLLATAPLSWSQAFPTQPVHLVVPQAPGGASDTLARIVAEKLSQKWMQPVIVENKVGAGGNIGMEYVARAPADGYTLLMTYVGVQAINGALYSKLAFNPESDFSTVATLATVPFVIVVSGKSPIQTVPDLVAAAQGGKLSYGSAGYGSVNHLLGVMFDGVANIDMTHVPYRGAPQAVQDVMGGQIAVAWASLPSVAGLIKDGSLRPLAISSSQRATSFPTIPTVAESGYKDFDVNPWFGFVAPAHVPVRVIDKINADVADIVRSPEIVRRFAELGAEPYVTSPKQFEQVLHADVAKWSDVVKSSGAHID